MSSFVQLNAGMPLNDTCHRHRREQRLVYAINGFKSCEQHLFCTHECKNRKEIRTKRQ